MRESESNLGCSVANPQESFLLVGAPVESAIYAEAAAGSIAVVGLRTSNAEKDEKVRLGIKGGCSSLRFLSVSRSRTECEVGVPAALQSSLWHLEVEEHYLRPGG